MCRVPRRNPALAALLLLCLAAAAMAQTVIRVDVSLVRILATVKNNAGELVGSLAKEDFEIYDNGVRQQTAVFERHTEQPLSIAILVDTSGSTSKELRYEIESVSRFLKALLGEGNPQDMVALYTFNWQVARLNYFTKNQSTVEHSLKNLKAEAGTALYDAIYLAAADLESREGRHVMIIVTDGGDTTSAKDFHAALEAAQMADSVLYPVLVMPITNDAGRNIGGENALTTMSNWRPGAACLRPAWGRSSTAPSPRFSRTSARNTCWATTPRTCRPPPTASTRSRCACGGPNCGYWRVTDIMVVPREKRDRLALPEFRSLPAKNGRRNSTQQDSTPQGPKGKGAARAPEQTFEEVRYLKHLIENAIPVRIKLAEGDEVRGTVEYYDQSFIRITRAGEPNLFIFKHDIKYMIEEGS